MPERRAAALSGVARTALPALAARALEQNQARPLLSDPLAVTWCEALRQDPAAWEGPATRVAVCFRAGVVDRWCAQLSAAEDRPVIVELGAGLSTRCARLGLDAAHGIAVDRPEMLELRRALGDDSIHLPGCMAEADLPARLAAAMRGRRPLLIAEGLFPYLEADVIGSLLAGLGESLGPVPLLFDAYRPLGLRFQRYHDVLRRFAAPLRSSLVEVAGHPAVRLVESRHLGDTPDILRRLPRRERLACRLLPGPPLWTVHRATLESSGSQQG